MTDTKKRLKFEERLEKIVGGYCYAQGGGDGGYEFGDIFKHIDKAIQEAVADERARVVGEVEKKKKDWPLWGRDTSPAEGDTSRKKDKNEGYNQAIDDVLALLGAESDKKD